MDIPDIRIDIREIGIRDIPTWLKEPPQAIPPGVPVTQEVGVPIVNIPGCVEAHEANNGSKTLQTDDPKGTVTFCDGQTPSFNPINYNPDEMEFEYKQEVPPVRPPEQPEVKAPETPDTGRAVTVDCPTEAQELKEPVGTLVDGGTKKITEYRLVGKECIPVKADIKIPDQIIQAIPSAGSITTTASIAVVATTSALLAKPLADLLLKVVKPTVKKVIKKIAAIRGKVVKIESLEERRGQQRIRNKAIRVLKGRG
ncbi:hypothetical protein SWTG_00127 [Synechococcus phage S-RIM2 R1_1999]|uniref:Uncharacterized protein n=2 Tax=Nerrivikvirus srim2 TaxID=2734125 RepID=A0A1D7RCQ7_9CAUD|nr:hypothetical protein SWTG_00127 [Synechococcus phage S-RIM2 R1_1999]AON99172.1 hypothetical protein LIS111010_157 [Synechococcus phage S-RIM2]AGH07258.1 hypothetical protein SWTG_00127 [Synechococcus phage S-RIM2 R1_1999]AOO02381.1 hypothetical protein Np191112_156 [Synechococcus phage S-RIM2]AOO07087.1 hypothetical protein RW401112_157 [Synechococcus phage S-RIM2]AOO07515.1 hypothetical protein W1010709_157 [Synechococcus phage S-RIM2]